MMVFNILLELFERGMGFSVSCVAFFVFRELTCIEKPGRRGKVDGPRECYFPEAGVNAGMISENLYCRAQ